MTACASYSDTQIQLAVIWEKLAFNRGKQVASRIDHYHHYQILNDFLRSPMLVNNGLLVNDLLLAQQGNTGYLVANNVYSYAEAA